MLGPGIQLPIEETHIELELIERSMKCVLLSHSIPVNTVYGIQ